MLLRYPREQVCELRPIDAQRRSCSRSISGNSKPRAMESLVEQAVAVAVPPETLQAIRPLVHEAEQCTALRLLAEHLSSGKRQAVKRPPQILRLPAHEDAD